MDLASAWADLVGMPSPVAPRAPPRAAARADASPTADASPMDLIRALASPRMPACGAAGGTRAAPGCARPDPGPGSGPGSVVACVPTSASAMTTGTADSECNPADQGACQGAAGTGGVMEALAPGAADAAPGRGENMSSVTPSAAWGSPGAGGTGKASGEEAAAKGSEDTHAQSGAGQVGPKPSARAERRVRLVSPVCPPQAHAEAKTLNPSPDAAGRPGPGKPAEAGGGQASGLARGARAPFRESVPRSPPAGAAAALGDGTCLSGEEAS